MNKLSNMKIVYLNIVTKTFNLVFIFTILNSCNNPSSSDEVKSFFVSKSKTPNRSLIIFVHGISGDPTLTWKNPNSGAYFPDLVAKDNTFKGFDVFSFGYPTVKIGLSLSVFRPSLAIDELTEILRRSFDNFDLKNYENIVFVCHSMGGLVVRGFLTKYQRYSKKVKLLYFFGTPTEGSDAAKLAKLFLNNQQSIDMMVDDREYTYLDTQKSAWLAVDELTRIPSYCGYETVKYANIGYIVPRGSALGLCNKPQDPISGNHMDIVKPSNNESDAYIAFRNAFKNTINENIITEYTQNYFPFTLYIYDNDESNLPISDGEIMLQYGNSGGSTIKISQGATTFNNVPHEYRGKTVNYFPKVVGYIQKLDTVTIPKDGSPAKVYLKKIPDIATIKGLVTYKQKPVPNVTLVFNSGIARGTTDALGNFNISVPLKDGSQVHLRVYDGGSIRYDRLVTLAQSYDLKISLE